MSSAGNQNPLSPYQNYRDCSLGICSIYCPQFCYLIFPPPPPSADDSGTPFSPLIIALIGVLASAFLLVSYYTVVTKFCKQRRTVPRHDNPETETRNDWPAGPAGMDDSLIAKITVFKYRKTDGRIDGTDCAVCLSEFREEEPLRLLPKCSHAFHIPCIDTWLKSQSNCPLCRGNVAVASPADANAYEIHRPEDLVLVVEDRGVEQTVVIAGDDGEEGVGRSVSFDVLPSSQRQLLVSDILKFDEIDDHVRVEMEELWRGIGSSEGDGDRSKFGKLLRSPVAMRRSFSTGRFMGRAQDKGKSSVIPN